MSQNSRLRMTTFFFGFIILSAITGVEAMENGDEEKIAKYTVDVTGDGKNEQILLKGIAYPDHPSHFEKVIVEVVGDNEKREHIELDGGFHPELLLIDLNHDGIRDLFVSMETGGSGAIKNHYLYTLKDGKLGEHITPDPLVIHSEFLNQYKARITIENHHKTHKFNLKGKADEYEQMGLYMDGKLNEPMELIIGDYDHLEPIRVKGKKVGLKGNQVISGAAHADVIGRVESTWLYKDGTWELLGTKVFELYKEKKGKK